ncbi:FHA domain-containing protein [Streptomyces sp. DSM 44917]|uniref:FHA domain-containing protein n=1 Tax=Streptomyces boetiae TaxID=3075541 RepID=A0ABU2L4D3_9ACTN|nr:FHA domain-containing protein [Streptomyces sp. DSM 44917]MDT0306421.1 FHA domain-containing protein [Streptomyces sp. DSM 44917]
MPTCPNGHQSVAEEWCEVCGQRILAPAVAVPPPPPPPPGVPGSAAQPPPPYPGPGPGGYGAPAGGYQDPGSLAPAELCPQCGTPREAQSPFCEECRYNFLTNSPTTYIPPVPPAPQHQGHQQHQGHPAGQMGAQMYGGQAPPAYPQAPQPPQYPGQEQDHGRPRHPSGDWTLPPPGGPVPHQGGPPPYPGQQPGGYPAPSPADAWAVTIGPDPEYFAAMMRRSGPEAAQLSLPRYSPEQRLPLEGPQVTIGRRRQSTGEAPDIDLSQPPEDPGVSHQHALLMQQTDGTWAVIDQDSTNGTTVNGAEDPIQPFVPVTLQEGDRIHIGAWTTLTLHRA